MKKGDKPAWDTWWGRSALVPLWRRIVKGYQENPQVEGTAYRQWRKIVEEAGFATETIEAQLKRNSETEEETNMEEKATDKMK